MAARSGQTYFFFAPLFIPFFILGVPIVDMAFAFVRRTANRTGFSTPDKNHLHHRLLRLGHGHRRSVLILWAWTVLLSGFILFPLYISSVNAVIPFGALALGVILYTLFHPSLAAGRSGPGRSRPSSASPPARRRPAEPGRPAVRHRGRRRASGRWPARTPVPTGATPVRRRPGERPGRGRSVNGVFPTFCRHGSGGAMMQPVNCRPPAPPEGIRAGRRLDRSVGRTAA